MKKYIISMLILAVLLSACSSTAAQEADPVVVHKEVQASSDGEIVVGASSLAQDTSVESEAVGVGQPSEEVEDVAPATETPSMDQPAPTFAPYPTLQSNTQPKAETPLPTATPVVSVAPSPTSEPAPTLTPALDDLATARISASIYEGPVRHSEVDKRAGSVYNADIEPNIVPHP